MNKNTTLFTLIDIKMEKIKDNVVYREHQKVTRIEDTFLRTFTLRFVET